MNAVRPAVFAAVFTLATLAFAGPAAAPAPAAGPLTREAEVALALEAGPPNVAAKAGVYVLEKSGYTLARKSENGFVCIVEHTVPSATEPQCLDPEGVRTFLPRMQLVASLRAAGKSEPDVRKAVMDAFASGKLEAPKRPGVDYMLSPHNVVAVDVEKGIAAPFPPHLMFYAPNMKNADVGSDGTPASPVFVVNEGSPHALMIVPVPVGDKAGPAHAHAHP
jgi:hypothetical protein